MNILLVYTSFLKQETEYNGYTPRRRNGAIVQIVAIGPFLTGCQ
jgi:hypothetical protein